MNWDVALEAWLNAVEGDADLTAALGGAHVYEAESGRKARVPSVEYSLITNPEDENTEGLELQVDIFARGMAQAVTLERRIRAVAHHDMPLVIGGMAMWSRHLGDARTLPYPAEEGVVHRTLGFMLEFARQEA